MIEKEVFVYIWRENCDKECNCASVSIILSPGNLVGTLLALKETPLYGPTQIEYKKCDVCDATQEGNDDKDDFKKPSSLL